MKNPHSSGPKKAKFVRHLPFEVAKTVSEAKFIAEDLAESVRYKYRGVVTLAGDASVTVGETIYLDNLDQGMSGYWTVLSVEHMFGGGNNSYTIKAVVGTDAFGDVDASGGKTSGKRDFEAELSNQSLKAKKPKLNNYTIGVNNGRTDLGVKSTKSFKNTPGPNVKPLATKYSPNIYKNEVPDFSQATRQVTWTAQ